VRRDYAEAVAWYRKAADKGLATAQYNLGVAYANGDGVLQDDAEAARWYRLAADQGYPAAQLNLGLAYANITVQFSVVGAITGRVAFAGVPVRYAPLTVHKLDVL
jgi:TPR repeat protein